MTANDFSSDEFDVFAQKIELDDSFANKRISVRYRRTDIKAALKAKHPFSRTVDVKLIDISSKGAAVISPKKYRIKSRVIFIVSFPDGRIFNIDAQVVHNQAFPRLGLKFARYQADLADHLLNTQTDLTFA